MTETTAFHRQATTLNQALMVGSVRQHELTEIAETLNGRMQAENAERQRREKELQRSNAALLQFAFAASHDLQEPLRGITLASQMLFQNHQGQWDDRAAIHVDSITKGAKQMRNLLADLLAYAEAGTEGREDDQNVDLNAVHEEVKRNLRTAIEECGAVVTSGDLPTLPGRASEFVQIFQNLIGNAIKYRGELPPFIRVFAEQRHQEWCFTVADNGIGIDPQYHKQIFGVFKRLQGKAIPGTGIGLAICQRVVERWSGQIWVESELGRGAKFCFTVPMSRGVVDQ